MLRSLSLATGGYLLKSRYPLLSLATNGYLFNRNAIISYADGVALSVVSIYKGDLTLLNTTTGALSFVSAYNSDITLTDRFTGEIMTTPMYTGVVK
tara:strand:- start:711 stop:998 length:288 start_codon:yes stop_codon:yes gene_type:complete